MFRSGIEALHKGQREAAISLGMTPAQSMTYIIMPQATRIILPPVANYAIGLLKDTSLCSLIGVNELMNDAKSIAFADYQPMAVFVLVAVIYFAMSFPLVDGRPLHGSGGFHLAIIQGVPHESRQARNIPVRVAYKHVEASSLINRGGITDVSVKITADNGLVGWGECTRAADTAGIESAVRTMAPLVIGRDPWDKEAIHRDLGIYAVWAFQPMTGNFAFAGIDMALVGSVRQGMRAAALSHARRRHARRGRLLSITWNGARPKRSSARRRTASSAATAPITSRSASMSGKRRRCSRRCAAAIGPDGQDQDRRQPGLDDTAGGGSAQALA